jgi:hypothetical protein
MNSGFSDIFAVEFFILHSRNALANCNSLDIVGIIGEIQSNAIINSHCDSNCKHTALELGTVQYSTVQCNTL